jgi:hypothetical protein
MIAITIPVDVILAGVTLVVFGVVQVIWRLYSTRHLSPMEKAYFQAWEKYVLLVLSNDIKHLSNSEKVDFMHEVETEIRKITRRHVHDGETKSGDIND